MDERASREKYLLSQVIKFLENTFNCSALASEYAVGVLIGLIMKDGIWSEVQCCLC